MAEGTAGEVAGTVSDRFLAHRNWWRQFWDRNWIQLTDGNSAVQAVPTATYPGKLLLGIDPQGGYRFGGTIADSVSVTRALSGDEITRAAKSPHGEQMATAAPDVSLHGDFTVAAWIKPSGNEHGRIFDKCTPGKADGLLFDTEPGNSLRYDLGGSLMKRVKCLKPGVWQHVAATFQAKTKEQRLYLD